MKKWLVKKKMVTELWTTVEADSRDSAKSIAEIEFDKGNCRIDLAENTITAEPSKY